MQVGEEAQVECTPRRPWHFGAWENEHVTWITAKRSGPTARLWAGYSQGERPYCPALGRLQPNRTTLLPSLPGSWLPRPSKAF